MTNASLSAVMVIAKANIKRFIRNRSFLVLGFVAPFALMGALSLTVGTAFSELYSPELVVVDEVGDGTIETLVDDLAAAGLEDIAIMTSEAEARTAVEDGDTEAAVIFPALGAATTGAEPVPIEVLAHADADADIAAEVAAAIARQSARTVDSVRILSAVGAPPDDLSGPLAITEDAAEVRILTDETYFAVGMASYFAVFAAAMLMATMHEERRRFTLARMLGAPVARLVPVLGKSLAVAVVTAVAFAILVVTSTLLLGADWGPIPGTIAIGLALCVVAVGVGLAVVSLTRTEPSAGQAGAAVATAWAIFGGVFLIIPPTGIINTLSRLSPFSWALKGIGINSGVGSNADVFVHAAIIAAFGLAGFVIAAVRRQHLRRVA